MGSAAIWPGYAPRVIWLGVDLGSRRIGLSVSDEDAERARPHDTLDARQGREAELIASAARDAGAAGVVLGLPLDMSGREGLAARRARTIAGRVRLAAPALEVELFDERLTSKEAERALRASGKRQSEQRGQVDRVAATLLLQAFLDLRRRRARPGDEA